MVLTIPVLPGVARLAVAPVHGIPVAPAAGLQPGTTLDAERGHFLEAPHLTVFPGRPVATLVIAVTCLGDALRDRLEPRPDCRDNGPIRRAPVRNQLAS